MLREMTEDDIAIITNDLGDIAASYGVVIPGSNVLKSLQLILELGAGYVVELDGKIVAATMWERNTRVNYLTVFYILPEYRTRKDVLIPLYSVVIGEFKGQRLQYKPLHTSVDLLTFCKDGEILLDEAEETISKLEARYGRK